MPEVYVRAMRWVSDDLPGFVECHLVDVDGVEHVLIDKAPVFDDGERLRPDAAYPIDLKLACRVLRESDADVVVELAHHVESVEGLRTFRVPRTSVA